MSSNNIPQMVNISHALQSSTIESMRSDIRDFNQVPELSKEQSDKIDRYISSLETAFAQFAKDNEHIEKKEDNVTVIDIQLYTGLKSMYMDYLSQLTKIKKEKSPKDEEVGGDQPLEYIINELPYQQPSERKKYIDALVLSNDRPIEKSDQLLGGIANLSLLDSTISENIRSYIGFLTKVGYGQDQIDYIMSHTTSKQYNSQQNLLSPPITKPDETPQQYEPNDTDDDSKNATTAIPFEDEPKKKISFSKYLKKGDSNDIPKRPWSTYDDDYSSAKKARLDTTDSLISILRDDNATSKKKLKKPRGAIKFVDDSKLVTVYGDDLPKLGLQVSPVQLKKILKPFKEGEPIETLLPAWSNSKAQELHLNTSSVENSDVTDIRGGPVSCETKVPLTYRLNFTAFSKDLDKPPKEPVDIDEASDNANNKKRKAKNPLIARAFGRNSLLLKKDRGGMPYKRVPEINKNTYPLRPLD